MKRTSLATLLALVSLVGGAYAQTPPVQTQSPSPSEATRPRVVSPPQFPGQGVSQRGTAAKPKATEQSLPLGVVVGTKPEVRQEAAGPAATERRVEAVPAASMLMSPPQIQARIAEAE